MTPVHTCPLRTQCDNISTVSNSNNNGFDPTIPVVDMKEFENTATRNAFLHKLEKALEIGFFGVINSPVDDAELQKGYDAIHQFFKSSIKQKQSINGKEALFQRGFVPGETALGQKNADRKEFLQIGPDNNLRTYKVRWNNLWPTFMNLEGPTMSLYSELMKASRPLLNAISLLLGQREDYLLNLVEGADNLMRCAHYLPNPKDGIWAAQHTDLNLMTILPRASAKGLEVELNGKWTPVVVPEGAFVVNVADMLEILSNGKWKSCIHRVVCNEPNTERESIVHFITTVDDAVMRPLGIGTPQFPVGTRMEILMLRILSLGYLDGNKEAQKEVREGQYIKNIKALVDSGHAAEPVKRWYAGYLNTIAVLDARQNTSKKTGKIAASATRAFNTFKGFFAKKAA